MTAKLLIKLLLLCGLVLEEEWDDWYDDAPRGKVHRTQLSARDWGVLIEQSFIEQD